MGSIRGNERVRRIALRVGSEGSRAQSGQLALGSKFMMPEAGSVGI